MRLHELLFRWQERGGGDAEDSGDLLLDQLMVGLQPGAIKQGLSRQMQRYEGMTFTDIYKEAGALEQELQDGKNAILSHRVIAPAPPSAPAANMEQLIDLIQNELQPGLIREVRKEIMEQIMQAMEEVRTQFSTREVLPTLNTQHTDSNTTA